MLAISSAGAGICQIILGTFIFLATSTSIDLTPFQFVPVAAFSAMIFIASCGAMPIPYVILGEILPDNVSLINVYEIYENDLIFKLRTFFPFIIK